MDQHTVQAFDQDLAAISAEIVKLGELATGEVADAILALLEGDAVRASEVVERDTRLDDLQLALEEQVVRLVARRQPVAVDLRRALSALKLAGELERVGDLAKNIAKRTLVIGESELTSNLKRPLARMGDLVQSRLAQALKAHVEQDLVAAGTVWARDREVDEQYESLFRELLTYMMSDPRVIAGCSHLLFVAKNLERIGDHATNIAELTHYEVTGEQLTARPKLDGVPR